LAWTKCQDVGVQDCCFRTGADLNFQMWQVTFTLSSNFASNRDLAVIRPQNRVMRSWMPTTAH
jgi:hypothetical protein